MKVVICLNGTAPSESLLRCQIQDADYVIAADGACEYLAAQNLRVDSIVGDFDSFAFARTSECLKAGGEIRKHVCEKDYTDGQLALSCALEKKCSHLVLLGALGGRPDHLLENFRLLYTALQAGVVASIQDDTCEVFLIDSVCTINGSAGQVVSLLPYTDEPVIQHSEGLQYPTENLLLTKLDSLSHSGVSNKLLGSSASVCVSSGVIIAFRFLSSNL